MERCALSLCFEFSSIILFLILFSARHTLDVWRQESPAFLPELVIPYDEGVFRASAPCPAVTSHPSSYREDYYLRTSWSPSPKQKKKAGRGAFRDPPPPPAPSAP